MAFVAVLVLLSVSQWAWQRELNRAEAQLVGTWAQVADQKSRLAFELDRVADENLVGKPMVERLCRQAIEIEGLDWGDEQIDAMVTICWRESRYDVNDQNKTSTAYGLFQFIDSTWQYTNIDKTSDPLLQTVAAVRYIENRYGTPTKALEFHLEIHVVDGNRVNYY